MSVVGFSWSGGRVRKKKKPVLRRIKMRSEGIAVDREEEWVPRQRVQYHTEP